MKKLVSIAAAVILALAVVAPVSAASNAGACAAWQNYINSAPSPIAAYLTGALSPYCH